MKPNMNRFTQRGRMGGGARAAGALILGLSLGACGDLLDVTLPAQLTDEVLTDPVGAAVQINSVITNYETALSEFNWQLSGHEDANEIYLMSPAASSGTTRYEGQANTPFSNFQVARVFAKNLHAN